MSNTFYCSQGHQNKSTNGSKPSFCNSCGKSMTANFVPSQKPSIPKNNSLRGRSNVIINEDDNESPEDIPDLNCLSYQIEADVDNSDIKSRGFFMKDIAFSNPGQDNTIKNKVRPTKAMKDASKARFTEMMNQAKTKTRAGDI